MTQYPLLPGRLRDQLERIAPSGDRYITYYPCAVTLDDGHELDRVYIVERGLYLRMWGVPPEQDRGRKSVSIDREDGKYRLSFCLPNVGKQQLDVGRKETELILTAGSYSRVFSLPDTLVGREIAGASFIDGRLTITFD